MNIETATRISGRTTGRHLAGTDRARAGTAFLSAPAQLARAQDGQAPIAFQIFPKGPELATVDGRNFKLSDPEAFVEKVNAGALPILVDYDHLSAFDVDDGGQSKAAGWIQRLEIRDGEVWAVVEWTVTAAEAIANREWRFISPEFYADKKTGEVTGLAAAALVNRPAFQMTALASASSTAKDNDMLNAIAKALGLKDDATEEEILAAIQKRDRDHQTELASAKAKAKTPSVDDFMPRADYDSVLARAETAESKLKEAGEAEFKKRVESEIAAAVTAGKITPATKGHYIALCSDEASLEKVLTALGKSPEVTSKSGIHGRPDTDTSELSEVERETAASLGVSEKDFLAAKSGNAA
jgi:phage I-like protein